MINKEVAKLTATMQFVLDKKSKTDIDKFTATINKYEGAVKKASETTKKASNDQRRLKRSSIKGTQDWMFPGGQKTPLKAMKDYYANLEKSTLKSQRTMIQNVASKNKAQLGGRLDWMFPEKKAAPLKAMASMYSAEEKAGGREQAASLRQTEGYFRRNTAALKELNVERARTKDRIKRQVFDINRVIKAQALGTAETNHLRRSVANLSRQFSRTGDLVQYKIGLKQIADQARATQRPVNSLRASLLSLGKRGAATGIGAALGGTVGAVAGSAAGMFGGPLGLGAAAVGGLGIAVVKTGMKLEGIENSMRMITGSAAEARQEFAWISNLSAKMGMNIAASAEGYTKFAIAAGDKIPIEETKRFFESFNKYSIAVGQNPFRYEKSLQALVQMLNY